MLSSQSDDDLAAATSSSTARRTSHSLAASAITDVGGIESGAVRTSSNLDLRLLSRSRAEAEGSPPLGLVARPLGQPLDEKELADVRARDLIGTSTRVAAFEQLKDPGQRAEGRRRLSAWLVVEARTRDEIESRIRSNADGTRATLVSILASDGTSESQRRLGKLLAAGPAESELVLRYLHLVKEPLDDWFDWLRPLAEKGESTTEARLAYGYVLGRSLHTTSPKVAPARSWLLQRLEAASGPSKTSFIDALGNSGDPAALPTLARLIESKDPELAASSLRAARRIPGAKADRIVSERFDDPRLVVRRSAVFAASYRELPNFRTEITTALRTEQDGDVRREVVGLLLRLADSDKTARTELAAIARGDRDPITRKRAADWLASREAKL